MSGMDRLTELLPCPFCGDNHATTTYTRDGRLVVCTSCGAKSGNYYHGPKDLPSADERAIAAWNRRASQAAPAPADGLQKLMGLSRWSPKGLPKNRGGVCMGVAKKGEWINRKEALIALGALHLTPAEVEA